MQAPFIYGTRLGHHCAHRFKQTIQGHSAEYKDVCVYVRACVRVDVDSSVGLSAGIQSAGDSVPDTLRVRILHYTEEDNSLACARASKLTTTNMYIAKARCECQTAVGWSGQNAP